MTERTPANPLCIKVAILIRDLMKKPETEILIGRQDILQKDFKTGYIVVDTLGASTREAGNEKFDGVTEVMTFNDVFKTEITVEFFGWTAYANAEKLTGLLRSQAAIDKKHDLGINLYRVSQLTDVKQLTGQQYGNRLQMTMIAEDNRTVSVETLRIDVAQFRILTEEKEIIL